MKIILNNREYIFEKDFYIPEEKIENCKRIRKAFLEEINFNVPLKMAYQLWYIYSQDKYQEEWHNSINTLDEFVIVTELLKLVSIMDIIEDCLEEEII